MPDQKPQEGHSASLLRALTWAGVSLAPVAAAVVLLGGSDNSARFAVVLIAVCVVLIGASMLIRSDPVLLRMDVEDRVAEEIDALRDELREEFAGAARATHHRVQAMQDEIRRLRANPAVPPAVAGGVPAGIAASAKSGLAAAGPLGMSANGPAGLAANGRPAPGAATGGRAAMAASAPGWPEPGPTAGGRATVGSTSVGSASASVSAGSGGAGSVGAASAGAGAPAQSRPAASGFAPAGAATNGSRPAPGEITRPPERSTGVVPPPPIAPVFRAPQRGGPTGSVSAGSAGAASARRVSGPPAGQYGTPRPADGEAGYGGQRGRGDSRYGVSGRGEPDYGAPGRGEAGYGGPPSRGVSDYGPPGHGDSGYDPPGRDESDYDPSGESDYRPSGHGDSGYGRPARGDGGYGASQRGESGHDDPSGRGGSGYGSARGESGHGSPSRRGEPGRGGPSGRRGSGKGTPHGEASRGRRRADITAVDLGYTGRRSRPDHAGDDEFDYDPEDGFFGDGHATIDPYSAELDGSDPHQSDWGKKTRW